MRVTRLVVPLLPLLLGAGAAGCSSSRGGTEGPPAPTTTSTVPATTSTTAAPATTTTVYAPTAPQGSPDAAASRLVGAWSSGDRAEAASVAAPPAVTALFAVPYPSGYLQSRGCTDNSTNPGTCTYRDTSTNAIYEISVSEIGSGWYVSAVTPEN